LQRKLLLEEAAHDISCSCVVGVLEMQTLDEIPFPDTPDAGIPVDVLPALLDNGLLVSREESSPALTAVGFVVFVVLRPEIGIGLDPLLYFPYPAIGFKLGDLADQGWTGKPEKRWKGREHLPLLAKGQGIIANDLGMPRRTVDLDLQNAGGPAPELRLEHIEIILAGA
jgi:hypothetical protein